MIQQIVAPESPKVNTNNRKERQVEFNDILQRWTEYYKSDIRILVNYLYSIGKNPTDVARILNADPSSFRREYPNKGEIHE